jgi:cytochrome c biogenesis protein CcdA
MVCQARRVLALVVLAISVGFADSLNPSTIAPALYLATGVDASRRLVHFTLGVFTVYLAGGIVLVLGPGHALLSAVARPGRRETHLIELVLGGVALALGVALWLRREGVARHVLAHERRTAGSSFALGAAIMSVELPTAFPYFAVVAADVGSDLSLTRQLLLIVIFNAAFIAPLAAIVVLRRLAGHRAERRFASVRAWIDRHTGALVACVTAVLAVALLLVGAVGVLTG